ncbi:extensin family protein [Parvibaculum sp.]|uniref:extensin-like domain-containing protein n=1 Tax=Parvibaculum sp. TaxID=2024848 RepID=UPI001B2A2C73|nr:extensin family protein [Parvibaculum sp.]MBO6633075.1 extensin family protein [Parvibaculum sp.]MBO6677388.1 extensin family protein [Parvibaculum sp.]MBO6684545.1 extensin family protein [Parvibaculum sp.]MBO6905744.1 extensin family protein [Parvibaculum sp.]
MLERFSPRLRRALVIAGIVFRFVLFFGGLGFAVWFAVVWFPDAYNPFVPPDIRDEPNIVTGLKLRGLADEYDICVSVVRASGTKYRRDSIASDSEGCGMPQGLTLEQSRISYGGGIQLTCPATAALLMWERHVVAPAAAEHLGSEVARVRHYGTYACRNVNNEKGGRRSGHARGDAIDISGFDLADGRRITVLDDWDGDTPEGRFLAAVHEGACGLFSTVLGPDYNDLHANHFHFEMARWGICR